MRVSNIRSGRIFRLALCFLVILPLLYLLANWSDNHKRVQRAYHARFGGRKQSHQRLESRPREAPKLVEGLGNFEPRNLRPRHGAGENGDAHILWPNKTNVADAAEMEYGMNIACSDEISMHRSVRDTRLEECKHWNYPYDLPTTSVIIVFHNEGFSVLMRTVHSVIDRSPKHVLHEIILVDDYSDKENLRTKLDHYVQQFQGLVKIIRNKEREGLIRTRSRGAMEATGEVIVFLDAHCEVNLNWLPPLLAPIYRDRTVMTVPIIDGIDHKTFEYTPVYEGDKHFRGIFEWGMLYKENDVPRREQQRRAHNSEPYRSPTHAGGLFAINRDYFLELGAYDPGLLVWGGENFELSFKIWQCGGSIEWVPCSRVGHVYRGFMPYNFGKLAEKKKGPLITINYKRVIETWFDAPHKEFFYTREPLARYLDMGDISEQLALKKRLNCKSFQWFMDNVAYDVLDKFPALPANLHWGELRSVASDGCLDSMSNEPPALMGFTYCQGTGNQLMRLNAEGQLGVDERCVEADRQGIKLAVCRLGTVTGPWSYDEHSKHLLHHRHRKCMALHPETLQLSLARCDANNAYQQWLFKKIRPDW
ncbi:GalNAc-T2 [Drosophila busckii]|uniref:Polypeptide N-acetylgalactosaminyltransferase n=1 Tax=Drosophila busckii TaxID=30019 RepID=A0A0M4ET62_DROBS|nr:N-acetylgalactosaminyltransferase 7 [Drosophila busckii]ALC48047.1 GalNAc-T2 [Drosophila busckii]